MTCKFIELHDSDNETILINPSWIACIEKNSDEGCSVRLGKRLSGEIWKAGSFSDRRYG